MLEGRMALSCDFHLGFASGLCGLSVWDFGGHMHWGATGLRQICDWCMGFD